MATSTIRLYSNTQITPQKNFAIDYIASYLASKLNLTINDFQYVKHGLNISIKIDYAQGYFDLTDMTPAWDYVSIQNKNDDRALYYFVMNQTWRGQSTIQLDLKLDTINSFALGTDYRLGGRTLIKREHRDRLKVIDGDLYRYIDIRSEQIPCELYKQSNEYIIENPYEAYRQSFYLMYRNAQTPAENNLDNAVNCYLIPKNAMSIHANTNDITLTFADFIIEGISYLDTRFEYNFTDNEEGEFYLDGDSLTTYLSSNYKRIRIEPYETYFRVLYYYGSNQYGEIWRDIDENTTNHTQITFTKSNLLACYTKSISWTRNEQYDIYLQTGGTGYALNGIDSINRTDSKIIKIIESPYIPVIAEDYVIPNGFNYEAGEKILQLQTLSTTFENEIPFGEYTYESSGETYQSNLNVSNAGNLGAQVLLTKYFSTPSGTSVTNVVIVATSLHGVGQIVNTSTSGSILTIQYYLYNQMNPDTNVATGTIKVYYQSTQTTKVFTEINVETDYGDIRWNKLLKVEDNFSPDVDELRNDTYESKIYHSDFFIPKFIYDSFSFTFDLEKVNKERLDEIYALTTSMTFKMTSTMNSRFLFAFPQYDCGNMQAQDYNHILSASRNNEMTLFNTPYINYIRGGYNYDVKNKERSDLLAFLGVGMSALGTLASIAGGGALTPLMATGFGTSLANAIGGAQSRESQMESKLKQLKLQATSVRGSDDVDLYDYYTGNRAKLAHYGVDAITKKQLFDLFYYYGYIANYYGIPNLTSRQKFNYIEADIDFLSISGKITAEMKNDMIGRYQTGLTIIHKYQSNNVDKWDIEQIYENWEDSIL